MGKSPSRTYYMLTYFLSLLVVVELQQTTIHGQEFVKRRRERREKGKKRQRWGSRRRSIDFVDIFRYGEV